VDSDERREARRQRIARGRLVAASARLDSDGGGMALVRPHLERVGEMRKERGELDMKSEIYLVCWREVQYKDEILAKWLAKIEFG